MPGWYDPGKAGKRTPGSLVTEGMTGTSMVEFMDLLNAEKARQSDEEAEEELMPKGEFVYADGWYKTLSGKFYRSGQSKVLDSYPFYL